MREKRTGRSPKPGAGGFPPEFRRFLHHLRTALLDAPRQALQHHLRRNPHRHLVRAGPPRHAHPLPDPNPRYPQAECPADPRFRPERCGENPPRQWDAQLPEPGGGGNPRRQRALPGLRPQGGAGHARGVRRFHVPDPRGQRGGHRQVPRGAACCPGNLGCGRRIR